MTFEKHAHAQKPLPLRGEVQFVDKIMLNFDNNLSFQRFLHEIPRAPHL